MGVGKVSCNFLHWRLPTAKFPYFTSSNKDYKIIYEK